LIFKKTDLTQPFFALHRVHQKTHAMQKFVFSFILLVLAFGCKKDEKQPLPPNIIQIDGQDWAYSASCGLVQPTIHGSEFQIKIDGSDGSFLVFSFSRTTQAMDSIGRTAIYYFSSSHVNPLSYGTDASNIGEVELLEIDSAKKTMSFQFEATLNKNGQKLEVRSGEIRDIAFEYGSPHVTKFTFMVEKNGEEWQFSEYSAGTTSGKMEFWGYSHIENGSMLTISIPCTAHLGSHFLTSDDSNVIFFPEHTTLYSWKLVSGQINLEENDLCSGKMRGTFQGLFQTYDNAVPQIELANGKFEVSYAY
jgi:hypothetical protein